MARRLGVLTSRRGEDLDNVFNRPEASTSAQSKLYSRPHLSYGLLVLVGVLSTILAPFLPLHWLQLLLRINLHRSSWWIDCIVWSTSFALHFWMRPSSDWSSSLRKMKAVCWIFESCYIFVSTDSRNWQKLVHSLTALSQKSNLILKYQSVFSLDYHLIVRSITFASHFWIKLWERREERRGTLVQQYHRALHFADKIF